MLRRVSLRSPKDTQTTPHAHFSICVARAGRPTLVYLLDHALNTVGLQGSVSLLSEELAVWIKDVETRGFGNFVTPNRHKLG